MEDRNTLFSTTGITDSVRMLHTPGDFARQNLLYVQEVGRLKSLQPHKSQRENLDSFLLLGVISGEGRIYIGEEEYRIKRGDCAFINCNNYYAHESSEDRSWELVWVHFNGNSAKAYYNLFLEQNEHRNLFRPDSLKDIQSCIEKLMAYQKDKNLESELQTGAALQQLLNTCLASVMHRESGMQDVYKKMCREIRECVNEKYRTDNLLHVLSERYDRNEEELDACFQKTYGITLNEYILNRRFTAAKELLRFTIRPVKEIIEESGIGDDELFQKLFKEGEGMTAEEYRMKWAQWVK